MAQQPLSPTRRQLAYLRSLAQATGTTFTPPRTRLQASQEIDRLKRRPRTPSQEVRADRRAVQDALAAPQSASAVTEREITGHGSSARWAGSPEGGQ